MVRLGVLRLDLNHEPLPFERTTGQLGQQDGLADAAQPTQDDAATDQTSLGTIGQDLERLDIAVPPGQCCGSQPGARVVRICAWIHGCKDSEL